MKKKDKVSAIYFLIIILFIVAFILLLAKDKKTALCPYLYAKSADLELYLDNCVPRLDPETDKVIENEYHSSGVLVKSKSKKISKTFALEKDFSPNWGPTARLQTNDSGNYLFLDEGTWVLRNLTIFSLLDGRTQWLQYLGTPLLVKNNYLIFENPSFTHPDAHPEVDQSAATNISLLRLSDFDIKNMAMGIDNIDFHLKFSGIVESNSQKFITVLSDDGKVIIQKSTWKDPKNYSAGQTATEQEYSPDEYIMFYDMLSSTSPDYNSATLKIDPENIKPIQINN